MTEQQWRAMGPALADYLERFLFCCDYTQTFRHLGTYCRGLLSPLERKTCEPIALAAGVPVRTLQLFLTQHGWDHDRARDLLQGHVAELLASLPEDGTGTVGVIDESGHVKKGTKTPGVHRQHGGEVGQTENGIVTVHLGVARDLYKSLIDAELFLPLCWSDDRDRCRAAGIPDSLVHRPKGQSALEQVDRALACGVHLDWLTFDEGYGCCGGFLTGLRDRQRLYVGEVPCSWWCFARPQASRPSRADDLVRHSPLFGQQPWPEVRLPRQTLGQQVWKYKAARVWPSQDSAAQAEACWLIWAVNEQSGEQKYFVSNAPADADVRLLLRVAFRRWNVEHAIRLGKQAIGLKHYEGRDYQALKRHLTLCLLMMGFVAEQTARQRGEKPGGDGRAGVLRAEGGVPAVAGAAAGDGGVGQRRRGDSVPPKAQPGRARIPTTARRGSARGAIPAAPTSAQTPPLPQKAIL